MEEENKLLPLSTGSKLAIEEFAIDARYVDCLKTFVETTLSENKVAQMFEVPLSTLESWKKEFEWTKLRTNYRKITSAYVVRKNTVKCILENSNEIAEQLNIVGNALLEDAFSAMLDDPMAVSIKDKMNFAIKIKELEAKVTGQIQASNTTNIVTQNTIFRKLSEEGIEGFYGADVTNISTTEVLEATVERPDYVAQLEAKKIDKAE